MPSDSRRPLFALLFALGAALLALTGCETTRPSPANPSIPEVMSTAQLRPGDSLSIALLGVPDAATHTGQIDEQGLIQLPYIGPVTAAALTTAELSQNIRQRYIDRKIYTAVDVAVTVTERYIYVGGEVARPGRIVWTPDLTLVKAIQAAGGFSLYARESKVTLVRDKTAYDLNVQLAQRDPSQDPRLTPGDSIQIPRSPF